MTYQDYHLKLNKLNKKLATAVKSRNLLDAQRLTKEIKALEYEYYGTPEQFKKAYRNCDAEQLLVIFEDMFKIMLYGDRLEQALVDYRSRMKDYMPWVASTGFMEDATHAYQDAKEIMASIDRQGCFEFSGDVGDMCDQFDLMARNVIHKASIVTLKDIQENRQYKSAHGTA